MKDCRYPRAPGPPPEPRYKCTREATANPPRHRQATSPTTNQRPITRQQRANPTPTTRNRQTPGPTGHCERTTPRNNHNPPKPRHNAQMESITATAEDLPRHPRKQHNHAPIPMPDPTHHQSVQPPLPWNR